MLERIKSQKGVVPVAAVIFPALSYANTAVFQPLLQSWGLSSWLSSLVQLTVAFLVGVGSLFLLRGLWYDPREDTHLWKMLGRTMVGPTVRLKLVLWDLQNDFHPSPPSMAVHRKNLEEFVQDMHTTLTRGCLEKLLYYGPSLHVAQSMRAIMVPIQTVYDGLNKPVNNDLDAEQMRDQASSQLKTIVDVIDGYWIQVYQNLPSSTVKLLQYLVEKTLYFGNDTV